VPRIAVALVAVLGLAACGGGAAGGAGARSSGGVVAAQANGIQLVRVGTFSNPVYVTAPPGDSSRLFVVEQAGRIRVIQNGQKLAKPFLDIHSGVASGGERGLLSMAFAPNYAQSGLFYVYFTGSNGDIHIQQFKRSGQPNVADPASRREVLKVAHSHFANHNGGQLQFGPDGKLYAGFGDGGGGGDPFGAGQRLDTLLAKLIRIDPKPGGGYQVPSDNPFMQQGAHHAIWAYGLRNPYRFSFDRKTGAMTVGDVGQDEFEEIDYRGGKLRGKNFGWSVFEGFSRYRSGNAPGAVKPVLALSHADGFCALIGGYVVRDPALTKLEGRYLYGDNCKPTIFSTRLTSSGAQDNHSTGLQVSGLSSFGEDAAGRVYATSLNGGVYRFAPK
jgi:glucose/arabinose dehydrogenase